MLVVQMAPPGLQHANLRVGKIVDRPLEQVGRWNEVGVEDDDEIPGRRLQPLLQGAGLETDPVGAMEESHLATARTPLRNFRRANLGRLIGRIVEYLDFEPVGGVVQARHRVEQPGGDEFFIVQRQLDGHARQVGEQRFRPRQVATMSVVQVDHPVPVQPVTRQQPQHRKINAGGNLSKLIRHAGDCALDPPRFPAASCIFTDRAV